MGCRPFSARARRERGKPAINIKTQLLGTTRLVGMQVLPYPRSPKGPTIRQVRAQPNSEQNIYLIQRSRFFP
jgi:hypothetical protein